MSITTPLPHEASRADRPFNPDHRNSAVVARPADFDPATHPILARHFFGIEPSSSIGPVAAEVIFNFKRQPAVSTREVPNT